MPQQKHVSACALTPEKEGLDEVASDDEWVQEVRVCQNQQLIIR